jgi:hypothetical protein
MEWEEEVTYRERLGGYLHPRDMVLYYVLSSMLLNELQKQQEQIQQLQLQVKELSTR